MSSKAILGIGSALVDMMIPLENDNVLNDLKLPKGSMTLVDGDERQRVLEATSTLDHTMVAGGSVANAVRGVASLGVDCGFIGSVGEDELGFHFEGELKKLNVDTKLFRQDLHSGTVVALVSQDGERTFATHLGAASMIDPNFLSEDMFDGYHYFFIEGYLVFNEELILTAAKMAKKAGLKVALDLAAFNVVEQSLDLFNELVDNYVDILFANEEEAAALVGEGPEEAVLSISERVDIAVVKIGADGALIRSNGTTHRVDVYGGKPVDTTGAGDLFAAGFLSGLAKGYSLPQAGYLGSILGGTVISIIGAQIQSKEWEHIKRLESDIVVNIGSSLKR